MGHGNRTVVMAMMQVLSGGPGEIIDSAAHRWTAHVPTINASIPKLLARNGFGDDDSHCYYT